MEHNIYKLSVIIPIYNVEKYIEKCVRSLLDQTLDSIEFIFINDCTPDNSINLLEKIIREYPSRKKDIKIIHHKKNRGSAASRNTGLKNATGHYIIQCDSDDWLDREAYMTMYNKAIKENSDIVTCNMIYEYNNYSKLSPSIVSANNEQFLRLSLTSKSHNSMCNKMIKRKIITKNHLSWIEGADMLEDTYMMTMVIFYSLKISFINEAYYHYRQDNNNSITSSYKKWSQKKLNAIIQNTNGVIDFFSRQTKYNINDELLIFALLSKNLLLFYSDKKERHNYHILYRKFKFKFLFNNFLSIRRKLVLLLSSIKCYRLSDLLIG